MRVKISCPECGKSLAVDDRMLGRKGKCSACGANFVIAAPEPPKSGSGGPLPVRPQASKDRPPAAGVKRSAHPPPLPPDDEILDAEELHEDWSDDTPTHGAAESTPRRPARRKAAAADDEYVDYDSYDASEYGGHAPRRAPRKPLSPKQRWARVRAGMLVCAIAACVFAGGAALKMISELLLEVGVGTMLSILSLGEEAKAEGERMRTELQNLSPQERMSRVGEAMELARKYTQAAESKKETGESLIQSGATVFQIAQFLLLAGWVATVGGLAFWLFAPVRNAAPILAGAALLTGLTVAILMVVFEILPLFPDSPPKFNEPEGADDVAIAYKEGREATLEAFGGMSSRAGRAPVQFNQKERAAPTGDKVRSLVTDLLLAATLILGGCALAAMARAQKNRRRASQAMVIVALAGGLAGALLLFYILVFMDWDNSESRWSLYLIWLLHWIANVVLGVTLFFYVSNLFAMRRVAR